MNIVAKIKNAMMYPMAWAHEEALSLVSYLKSVVKSPIVRFEKKYKGQNIFLIALYEKGRIRPDIENLLLTAKRLDMYVLAVNTLKIDDVDDLKNYADCYIETSNFGRDFGSYKTGFLHVYKNGWEESCQRLLMSNDSLFYAKENLQSFLQTMISTNEDILGATENHQYRKHLGSFFISLNKNIVRAKKFRKFWKNYKRTNVRPKVIARGELELSKTLQKVAPDGKLKALYDVNLFTERLHDEKIYKACLNSLLPPTIGMAMGRMSLVEIFTRLLERKLYAPGVGVKKILKSGYMVSLEGDVEAALNKITSEKITHEQLENIKLYIKGILINQWIQGSQIHQNCLVLIMLGCPIIKLDLLYRGVINYEGLLAISQLLADDEEMRALQTILSERPFGLSFLSGLDQAKFTYGIV